MADNQVVTELVLVGPDTGPAIAALGKTEAAVNRLAAANDNAEAAIKRQTATMTQSYSTQASQFTRMQAAVDQAFAAQMKLEKATVTGAAAVAAGRVSQEQYNTTLQAYRTRLEEAEKGSRSFFNTLGSGLGLSGENIKGIFEGIGIGFGLQELMKIPGEIQKIVHETAGLQHTAETIGITTKNLQELQFAGGQVHISADTMSSALERFSKNLGLASEGTGALSKVLKLNHVAISGDFMTDFKAVANLIENAGNAEQRNILITQMFGKSAQEMGLLFVDGAAGIQRAADQADGFGVVISDEKIRHIAEMDKKFTALATTIGVVFREAVVSALTWVDNLVVGLDNFLSHASQRGGVKLGGGVTFGEGYDPVYESIKSGGGNLAKEDLGPMSDAAKRYMDAYASLQRQLSAIAASELSDATVITGGLKKMKDRFAADFGDTILPTPKDPAVAEYEKLVKQFDGMEKSLVKATAAQKAQTDALGLGVGPAAAFRKEQELINFATENHIKLSAAKIASIHQEAAAYGDATQRLAEAKSMQDLTFQRDQLGRDPMEQQVASTVRSVYGPDYQAHMHEAIANQARFNLLLQQSQQDASNFANTFVDGLMQGKSAIDALSGSMGSLGSSLLKAGLMSLAAALVKKEEAPLQCADRPTTKPANDNTADGHGNERDRRPQAA